LRQYALQTRLAHLLGWGPSTIRRNLAGKSKIRKADELTTIRGIAGG
jgi:hypothetical protein